MINKAIIEIASKKTIKIHMPQKIFEDDEGLRESALITALPKMAMPNEGPNTVINIIHIIRKVSANIT